MKFLSGGVIWALLLCLYINLYAQVQPSAISGKVLNENHLPAAAATIVLLKLPDSTILNSAVIGKEGVFRFNGLTPGRYVLLARSVGYVKYVSGPCEVKTGQTFTVADIILSPGTKQLKEIAIVSSKPEIEVKPGKIILNVQNSILAAGNSAFDILRQSPGVRVDNTGIINITGRQAALITIDGKPTGLTGDELATYLKGLQSNTIDRIELITSGSAKYDASGGGIVNIVMKKGKNIGANITVTAAAGYGKYYKSNAGLVFNDRTDKFNIFGNYNFTDNKTFHDFTTDRIIDYNNLLSNYRVDYNSDEKIKNNTFSFGADFFIAAKQTIGFLVNGSIEEDNFTKDNNLKIFNQSALDSTITANSSLNRHISKVNYNLNYNASLDKTGKTLSADLNYNVYNRSSAEYITNKFYNSSGSIFRPDSLLQNVSPSSIHNWLGKVDFTSPLSKTSKLEAGVKYSKTTSNNNQIFGALVNGQYQNDPMFSNYFVYTENVNAAYVNFESKLDKLEIATGLRAEQTIAAGNSVTLNQTVKNNYTDLFPNALITYTLDNKDVFSLSYHRGIHRPEYQLINPFYYYIDLYDYGAGNQYLKPEYTNSIELSYNYNKTFLATLYTTIIGNAYNFEYYVQNDTTKVNINRPTNLGTIYNYGVKFFTPAVFTSWWNANFSVDASYQRYIAYPENGSLNKGTPDIIFSGAQYFAISKSISAFIDGKYETPTFYGISHYKAAYSVNSGIAKQLFNKKGSLKLNAADIFNTVRDRFSTNYQNLNLSDVDKRESQVVKLTFTYRFGKTSVKSARVHHTGNEDEQSRIKETN